MSKKLFLQGNETLLSPIVMKASFFVLAFFASFTYAQVGINNDQSKCPFGHQRFQYKQSLQYGWNRDP